MYPGSQTTPQAIENTCTGAVILVRVNTFLFFKKTSQSQPTKN